MSDEIRLVLLLDVYHNHLMALSKYMCLGPVAGESASAGLRIEHKHMYFERAPQMILTDFFG